MASVHRRKSDKARGKAGKYTCTWLGADDKRKSRAGTTDKAESLKLAQRYESEARLERDGLIDPAKVARRTAAARTPADHVDDYRRDLLASGFGGKHAAEVASVLRRLLAAAQVDSVAALAPDRIRLALGAMRDAGRSARTCNHAIVSLKAFARWLAAADRIKEVPKGVANLATFNEREDRRRVRRAATMAEIARLLAAAEAGPTWLIHGPAKSPYAGVPITGPERAALYRLALGTGFRAEEIRTLTPEMFQLDGDNPSVIVLAGFAKNGKQCIQPITRELAEGLRPFVAGKPAGKPVLPMPSWGAKMLRRDLESAGIPYRDDKGGVLDFHALRHSYITHLIMSGANPKIVQVLARHSTIVLTIDRYSHVDDEDLRKALENQAPRDPKAG